MICCQNTFTVYLFNPTDVEDPTVVSCKGPKTDSQGFIYAENQRAMVNWDVRL